MLSIVARQQDPHSAKVRRSQSFYDSPGVVTAGVLHKDQFDEGGRFRKVCLTVVATTRAGCKSCARQAPQTIPVVSRIGLTQSFSFQGAPLPEGQSIILFGSRINSFFTL